MASALLWLSDTMPRSQCFDVVYLWQGPPLGNEEDQAVVSLPHLVRQDSELWQERYRKWVFAAGQYFAGLGSSPRVPTWILWLKAQPAFVSNALPYTAVRMWALLRDLERRGVTRITVEQGQDSAAFLRVLNAWAGNQAVDVKIHGRVGAKSGSTLGAVVAATIKGSAHLVRETLRYARFPSKRGSFRDDALDLVVVDYLANISFESVGSRALKSGYWTKLIEVLAETHTATAWVHIDVRSSVATDVAQARSLCRDISARTEESHRLLQDDIDLRMVAEIWVEYGRMVRAGLALLLRHPSKHMPGEDSLWPLVLPTFVRGHFGTLAATNSIWRVLAKRLAQSHPSGQTLMYLMEGQSWESELVRAWKEWNGGKTIGVIHSLVREWDTRYWLAPGGASTNALVVIPDEVVSNGPAATRLLTQYGYPSIIECEALRYLADQGEAEQEPDAAASRSAPIRLMVLADYDAKMTTKLLDLASVIGESQDQDGGLEIAVRPHPASPLPLGTWGESWSLRGGKPIEDDLHQADVVLCGSVSSSLINALLTGVPVLVYDDPRYLDGRPGEVRDAVHVVGSAKEALEQLRLIQRKARGEAERANVFDRDPSLKRWRQLIAGIHTKDR